MPARVKITEQMVDAAINEIAIHAMRDGFLLPLEEESPEEWVKMRVCLRAALSAAAAVAVRESAKP